jgi:histidinol dehydrogenase
VTIQIIEGTPAARAHIARLRAEEEAELPARVTARLRAVFGRAISPQEAVAQIVADVRRDGDAALRDYTRRIDGVSLDALALDAETIEAADRVAPPDLRDALHRAANRIRAFHEREPRQSWLEWDDEEGALGQMIRPLRRVGVYVPGGTAAYPSSLLMAAIPAQVAGVEEIVVTTPPGPQGTGAAATLAAARVVELERVFLLGGAQAIAALAYGTQSIPRVDKIVGPGNIFVVLAKRHVYGMVDIDGLPGPTETLVIADANADPALVAADLLAQAEHDTLASAILVTPSQSLAVAVEVEVACQVEELSRADVIAESLRGQGGMEEAVDLANGYAAEHLCLHVADPWSLVGQVKHAGGVFLGENSYEVLGDYVAGPTHVMPTMGTARFASPLSVRDFTKIISLFGLDEGEAREISQAAQRLAEAEGLTAHAAAVARRARNEG